MMAALAGVYSVIDKNHAVYDEKVDKEAYAMVSLGEGDVLEQEFLAEEDVLDSVNVKMSASGDIGDAEISFVLTDEDGGKAAEGTRALNDLKPGKFFPLKLWIPTAAAVKESPIRFGLPWKNAGKTQGCRCTLFPERAKPRRCRWKGRLRKGRWLFAQLHTGSMRKHLL